MSRPRGSGISRPSSRAVSIHSRMITSTFSRAARYVGPSARSPATRELRQQTPDRAAPIDDNFVADFRTTHAIFILRKRKDSDQHIRRPLSRQQHSSFALSLVATACYAAACYSDGRMSVCARLIRRQISVRPRKALDRHTTTGQPDGEFARQSAAHDQRPRATGPRPGGWFDRGLAPALRCPLRGGMAVRGSAGRTAPGRSGRHRAGDVPRGRPVGADVRSCAGKLVGLAVRHCPAASGPVLPPQADAAGSGGRG